MPDDFALHAFDLISDALLFGRLWYLEVRHAIGYAEFLQPLTDAVIHVYDEAGNVIGTRANVEFLVVAKCQNA